MARTGTLIFAALAITLLAGCSGLSVGWVFQASYNTPSITQAQIITQPEEPRK